MAKIIIINKGIRIIGKDGINIQVMTNTMVMNTAAIGITKNNTIITKIIGTIHREIEIRITINTVKINGIKTALINPSDNKNTKPIIGTQLNKSQNKKMSINLSHLTNQISTTPSFSKPSPRLQKDFKKLDVSEAKRRRKAKRATTWINQLAAQLHPKARNQKFQQ